jgi:hypothetical protein
VNVKPGSYICWHFQAESVRDTVWESDWVGTPVSFQRCLIIIIAMADKNFSLTAGKFVTVSNKTMLNVSNGFCNAQVHEINALFGGFSAIPL